MADRITIINAALSELGEEVLEFASPEDRASFQSGTFFDVEDDIQIKTAHAYPLVRATMLNAHSWSWLKNRTALNVAPAGEDDDVQAWPFPHRYTLPDLYIGNIRGVWDDRRPNMPARTSGWDVNGPFLFADFTPAWIETITNAGEESWPSLFENAFVLMLVSRLALSIKEDIPTVNAYKRLAQEALAEAMRVDGQSHPRHVAQLAAADQQIVEYAAPNRGHQRVSRCLESDARLSAAPQVYHVVPAADSEIDETIRVA